MFESSLPVLWRRSGKHNSSRNVQKSDAVLRLTGRNWSGIVHLTPMDRTASVPRLTRTR
ncbi:hypothetical protein FHX37_0256 [Haloactinospora alba]|uniref:Uncharacterized protein n=1 Tax=Haloactinospora alba TaxID=405555 RepID=A0A543NEY8_9ACTN|nr:hypothetical protein FHX37_0256 [Haloactinospora alba]